MSKEEILLKREAPIEQARGYDKSWNSLGEPRGPLNRFRDSLIDHLVELPDAAIESIDDLDSYDYAEGA